MEQHPAILFKKPDLIPVFVATRVSSAFKNPSTLSTEETEISAVFNSSFNEEYMTYKDADNTLWHKELAALFTSLINGDLISKLSKKHSNLIEHLTPLRSQFTNFCRRIALNLVKSQEQRLWIKTETKGQQVLRPEFSEAVNLLCNDPDPHIANWAWHTPLTKIVEEDQSKGRGNEAARPMRKVNHPTFGGRGRGRGRGGGMRARRSPSPERGWEDEYDDD